MQFATSDEAKCPIDQLLLFADAANHPGTPSDKTSLSVTKLTMEDGTKGINTYYMSVASRTNGFISALYTGTIIVCSLETIEVVSPGPEVISVE